MSVLNLLKTIFHPTLYRKPSAKVACHDLSPVTVTEFTVDGVKRTLKEPLILIPQLTESKQFMILEDDNWGISVFGETRDELMKALADELDFLWKSSSSPITQAKFLGKSPKRKRKSTLEKSFTI